MRERREKMKTDQKLFSDALVVAFLSLKGFQVKPHKLENGRVAFEVIGENVEEAVEEFYSNIKVPVSSFCSAYRTVRSIMFNARGYMA